MKLSEAVPNNQTLIMPRIKPVSAKKKKKNGF